MPERAPSSRNILGANVRKLRRARGWTQIQLAAHCEMTQVYISYIEGSKHAATVDMIDKLAEALECSPATLLTPADGQLG